MDEHKTQLHETLADAMAAVDRAGVLWPAPSTRPIDVPAAPGANRPAAGGPELAADIEPSGPPTAAWSPSPPDHADLTVEQHSPPPVPPASASAAAGPRVEVATATVDVTDSPNEQALDDFFDDGDEVGDDRRFGSRLRRRR